jgi:hypothetical protein
LRRFVVRGSLLVRGSLPSFVGRGVLSGLVGRGFSRDNHAAQKGALAPEAEQFAKGAELRALVTLRREFHYDFHSHFQLPRNADNVAAILLETIRWKVR